MTDRREFLKGALAVSAVLAAPSVVHAAKPYPMGIAPLSLIELNPAARVACAAEAGYASIVVRLLASTPTEAQYNLLDPKAADRVALDEQLKRTGLKVNDIELIRFKPDFKASDDLYKRAFEAARSLGAQRFLVICNDTDMNRTADNYAALCDVAAPYKLGLPLEFMPFTPVKSLKDAVAIVKKVNKPNASIAFDIMHHHYSHGTIEDIKAAGSLISSIHLCDGAKVPPTDTAEIIRHVRGGRPAPGKGGIDVVAMLKALPKGLPVAIESVETSYKVSSYEKAKLFFDEGQNVLAKAGYSM